ncbi:MAG: class I SAM-dependent methyltransferase [Deltaproteobacteria bacterium]|nr:class I SAM-dependent methyltransferase [Deltaproteobacteria bacterium]
MQGLMMKGLMRQFAKPEGVLGRLAGWIMAHRSSNIRRNQWTVELLGLGPEDQVLEIGCGPGLALGYAAGRLAGGQTGGRVTGLDHSAVMLGQAARRNRREMAAGKVRLQQGGLDQLAEMIEAFDQVYSVNVFMFFPDPDAALNLCWNALKPGGQLATAYMPRHRGARPEDTRLFAEDLARRMVQQGFQRIRTETLDLRPIPAVCVLGQKPGVFIPAGLG